MEIVLDKQGLADWVALLDTYKVYAPVKDDGIWNYQVINDAGDIRLEHTNTVHSPKKIAFPQREVFFEFEQNNGGIPDITEVQPEETENVVFGVRPCDGKATTLMDSVFSGELEDKYYWARRNRTTYVGLACNAPHATSCFCTAVGGSPSGTDGLDILMTDLGESFYMKPLTQRGEKLLKLAERLGRKAGVSDKEKAEALHNKAASAMTRAVNGLDKAAQKLKGMFDSPFWDSQSKGCISCGICTFLCPTCHCFDINDEVTQSSPLKGQRVRTWDSCQFPDFTMHSSSHNPRDGKKARMRQRVCHKFQYFFENYGSFQCTGCGRCISECPVSIDIAAVMNGVADYDG